MPKLLLLIRLLVVDPPAGVTFAVQRGRDELVSPVMASHALIVFQFHVQVADASTQPPRLVGEFTQGPPKARFVYINSGTLAGQAGSCWTRRAKVLLGDITATLIDATHRTSGFVLEATISGTGRDGGPACASVPLLGDGWTVQPV